VDTYGSRCTADLSLPVCFDQQLPQRVDDRAGLVARDEREHDDVAIKAEVFSPRETDAPSRGRG
jgi:hypothetical protein